MAKGFTDDRTVDLVRALSDEFNNTQTPSSTSVQKYDQGTQTFYSDEEMARQKIAQPLFEIKRVEPERTIDESLSLLVENKDNVKVERKQGFSMTKTKKGDWHSR